VCGIAGLFEPGGATGAEELGRDAAAMADALTHRGPDAHGLWVDPEQGVAFGYRRLAVVDLGPGGAQPMVSSDGRWVLIYNGELYNTGTLRKRLVDHGVAFRGSSDTEVLLEAIGTWGLLPALESCEGMFAFSLWDRRQRELHLVRDRFGEKPLYYGWVGRRLAFASELKSLYLLADFRAEIDRDAVALYLRHNCIPAPHTIYRGISKLLPGQLVTVDVAARPGGILPTRSYWSAREAIEDARKRPFAGTDDSMVDQFESVLSESVGARMLADVPVGAFLSGGVDSSTVVALMQRHSSKPVRTFTVGFADRAFDESTDAAAVAAHLGTDHTPLQVTDSDAIDIIPDIPNIWDEPFGDVSAIPMHLVSKLARSEVTVALSGDGGDELLAGYNRHAWLEQLWRRTSILPAPVRRFAGSALVRLPPTVIDGGARVAMALPPHRQIRNATSKVAKTGKVLAARDPEEAYLALVSYWEGAESMVIGAGPSVSMASRPSDWPTLDGITEQMLWLDLVSYLPDDILTKLDRAAMATSLETRVPFLDRAVFDLAWRLPMRAKLREGTTKWILRQVLYRHVPPELVERPKMGFGFPIGSMLRGPLRGWAEELLGERRLRSQGLLDPEPIRRAWQQHLQGSRDLALELWDVLALQAWLERWLPGVGH
jgi:asparagine synthase (glutamine-hydrolysing)